MKLGTFEFATPVCSAPMAGVTDKAYRLLAREFGCNLIWTEMVSDKALTYRNSRTLQMLDITEEKQPIVVQLFGSEPQVMAEAAKLAVERGAKIIDINMGCPAPKVVKNCEGSALLKNLPLAQQVAAAVVKAVSIPITVKFRLGWSADHIVGVQLASLLEDVGVTALTVHGRTREQMYSGKADWNAIAQIKSAVSIPVIGNGDIGEPQDAREMIQVTACDGVMIGRGALGNPWIFRRTAHYLRTGELLAGPTANERISLAQRHLELLIKFKGEKVGVQEMRKHAAWYIKGLRDSARVREKIMNVKSHCDIDQVLEQYKEELETFSA